MRVHGRIGIFARELERHAQPRQWRAKLMGDVAKQEFLRIDERLEPLRHVVETVNESVELIALEESASRRGFGDPGAQIALRELQGGLTQANDRASEDEHQNEGCESADCNGYGQLWRCKMIEVLKPGVLLSMDGNDGNEEVAPSAGRGSGRAPDGDVAGLAGLHCAV